ncbi:MAG: peptidylprolyl isomerase [Desulfitobacteriaceae bacterium]|nr:peptidylprolyl isomerase [Desulfitobacteriaceae bacterium]MDD4400273.1 peptidylprolyl isomerase [Desulfitobacteriaceae bacterium]
MKGWVLMKKSLAGLVTVIFVMILTVTGCTSSKWVAKVNGTVIGLDQYNTRVNDAKVIYEKQQVDFTTEDGKETLIKLKKQILECMILNEIISQEVQKLKLKTDDPKISEKEIEIKQGFDTEEQFQERLKWTGMTESDLQNYLSLNQKISSDTELTEDDIKAYYEKNYDQVKASHILVDTEEEANEIIVQLKEGANFEQLAKEKSIDEGSKSSGGELGYFSRGQMIPEFEKAAFEQKVGEYSGRPVKTEYGYHIILVEEYKQASAADLAAKKDIVATAAINARIDNYIRELRDNAKIEYAEEYKPETSEPAK